MKPEFDITDYHHENDFDPPDINWIEVTKLGSAYREQMATNKDLWRHRPAFEKGPWVRGPAPL